MEIQTKEARLTIRDLNDEFRKDPWRKGRLMATSGVSSMGHEFLMAAVRTVRDFNKFNDGNDPHGEHDFGSFELGSERLFWKIDTYDLDLQYGSPDPADPKVSIRVLTIMLAEEY